MADSTPLFPSQTAAAPAAEPAGKHKSPLRWIVPLILFVAIIGGIAWVTQNISKQGAKKVVAPPEPKNAEILLGFVHPFVQSGYFVAPWEPLPDKKDIGKPLTKKPYAREFERNEEGRYYFPFKLLRPEQAVEVGLGFKSCDCAKLFVAIVTAAESEKYVTALFKEPNLPQLDDAPLDWKSLDKTEENGITLPSGSYAILRMVWTNRRGIGESLNLEAQLWARVPGSSQRQMYGFKIDAVSTHPLRAKNDRIDVGMIDPGGFAKAEFLVWSPTRDEVKFKLNAGAGDSLFKLETVPLSPAECADFQAKLRAEEIVTRVRAAWRVTVTVHEQSGSQHLDLGHFIRAVKIDMPGAPEDIPSLVLYGRVRSEVRIGGAEDQGKVNLKSFVAKFGTKKSVVLSTDNPKVDLELSSSPPGLLVELVPEKSAKSKQWRLKVEVPPAVIVGPVPDDFVVILRIKGTPRSVRVPIIGNGVQG